MSASYYFAMSSNDTGISMWSTRVFRATFGSRINSYRMSMNYLLYICRVHSYCGFDVSLFSCAFHLTKDTQI